MQVTINEKLQVISTIAKIHRAIQRELNRRLKDLNLTYLDFLVLRSTIEGPKPMVYIANRYYVTQATITSSVDKLENIGLVRRVRSSEDRRVVLIEITEKGKGIYEEGLKLYRELVEEIMKEIRDEEVLNLLDKLNMILSKLG